MSDDPLRDEANRAAHRGMTVLCSAVEDDTRIEVQGSSFSVFGNFFPELVKVAHQYEDLQRRQQAEATR